MSELATIPKLSELPAEKLAAFTKTELMYISFTEEKKFSQIEEDDLMELLYPILEFIYRTIGHNYDGTVAAIIAKDLAGLLKKYHTHYSLSELKEAVRRGAIKQYGEIKSGISASLIVGWLNSFHIESETVRKIALSKFKSLLPGNELTDEKKEEIFSSAFDFSFNHFQKTSTIVDGVRKPGIIIDTGNAIFDGLKKRGKIKISDEKFNLFIESELFRVTGELNQKFNMPCLTSEDHIRKKTIEQKIESLSESSPEIISGAKNEILKQFYTKLNPS